MEQSLAQHIDLQCPQCGAGFAADVWLIIDAAARPDLLARVRDGSIHTLICPNGHGGEVDAPLLIYRPGETPPLLFSPAQRTTAEQDREQAAGLVGQLREGLGGAWRDEWLAGFAPVPRRLLAAALSGDPAALEAAVERSIPPAAQRALGEIVAALAAEGVRVNTAEDLDRALAARPELRARLEAALRAGEADAAGVPAPPPAANAPAGQAEELPPLMRKLIDFIETPDWLASYRFLLAHPALLGEEADALLGQLLEGATAAGDEDAVALFTEHRALLARCREVGTAAAYAAKLGATPEQLAAAAAAEEAAATMPPATRQALDEIMAALRADGVTANSAEELQAALATRPELRARLEAALAAAGEAAPETATDPLRDALQAFIQAETWFASYQFVVAHPELLSDAADAALMALVERALADDAADAARVLIEHLALLRRARAAGPETAFAEKLETTPEQLAAAAAAEQTAATIPPATRQALDEIMAALRADGMTVNSVEELQAALATRPALAAKLEAALGGGQGDGPDVPAAFRGDVDRAKAAEARYRSSSNAAALDEAAAAWERVLNAPGFAAAPPRFRLAALNDAGSVFLRRYWAGGRLPDLDRAVALWEAAVAGTPAGSPDLAMYQNNLGTGLRDRYARTGRVADLDAAIAAYEAAVAGTPAGSPDLAGYQNNLGNGLRDRYARTGRVADLDAAIATYLAAVDTLDQSLLDSPVAFVVGQQSRYAGLHARTVAALVAAGRAAEALAVAEGTKSRLLAGLMGRDELPAPAQLPDGLLARERAAAGRLRVLDTAALAGAGGGAGHDTPAGRAAVVAELRAVWEQMAALGPAAVEYVALRRGDRPSAAGLARLAAALPPGAALLSIFDPAEAPAAGDDGEGPRRRVLLFLLRAGAAEPVVIEATLDDDGVASDYLPSYVDEVLNGADHRLLGRPVTQRWRGLGRPLLGPLLPHLPGIDSLVISPEGIYHQLPLHALWLDDAGTTLLDHCAVSTVPGLGALARLLGRDGASGGGAAVFGYTPADTTTERGRWEHDIFTDEAKRVAHTFGVAPTLDGAATGAALEAATAGPLACLHLSCHGRFDGGDALRSGVLLADGVYTARRFMARRLPVDLVTLSACETGVSGALGGDEMAGLSMALLSAGARSLLLGLWSVNAVTTAWLMDDFYRRAAGDAAGRAETLRRTMLAFRDGAILPPRAGFDPGDAFYWAPFALVGDWR